MSRYIPVEPEKWGEMVKAMAEVKRLQAEVERLEATWPRDPHHGGKVYDFSLTKVGELQAEVERLTKYGDILESGLRTLPGDFPRCLANEWKAAKEGKQS